MGAYLSTSIERNKSQFWTTNLYTPDRVRQELAVDPLELLEVLAVACIRCVVDVRDLLDAGHMLQLQERFLAVEQIDAGVKLDTLVGFKMRVGVCQRTVREAYDARKSAGCWVGEEGLEDGVSCDAGGAEHEGSQGDGRCRHCELLRSRVFERQNERSSCLSFGNGATIYQLTPRQRHISTYR